MAKELQDTPSYASQVPPIVDPRIWISTGSLALDAGLGRGIPKYRITQIYGPSQSRKTTLLLSIIAQAQKVLNSAGKPLHRCIYYTSEVGFLEEMAIYFGVDLESLRYKEVYTVEDFFNHARDFCRKSKEDGYHPVIFLDSMSGLTVQAEMFAQGGVAKEFHYPPHPRKISQGWRVLSKTMMNCRATAVVVDHEKPTGVPGGAATGFFSQVRIQMVGVGPIRANPDDPLSKEIGFRSDVRVVKNRGTLNQTIPFRFYYRPNPIDPGRDMWTFLLTQEIAKQNGAWWNIKPYIQESFYEKDWAKIYQKYINIWPKIVGEFYKKRFKEYCELRKIDPVKYLDDFAKTELAKQSEPEPEIPDSGEEESLEVPKESPDEKSAAEAVGAGDAPVEANP